MALAPSHRCANFSALSSSWQVKSIFTLVDIRDDITENILGRDVLNWFRLTLSAQENLVRVEEV